MQYSDDSAAPGEEPEYEGFDLKRYLGMWEEAVDDYADPRKQHYRDEEYYDGDVKGTGWGHWTEAELAKLGQRDQPPTTRNLIERKVNAVAGVEQRSRSEPRALPRTPKDQKSAEIATDALRFVKEKTRWTYRKADAFMEALKVGFAAVEIGGAEDHVPITPIEWKDFFFDPRSRRPDFSDARYLGVAKWIDKDVAVATYVPPMPEEPAPLPPPELPPRPDDPAMAMQWAAFAQQIIGQYEMAVEAQRAAYDKEVARRQQIIDTIEGTSEGEGSTGLLNADQFEDRPSKVFCDRKRRRIFVIDMWHRDPAKGWYRCVFTGGGKLFTQEATLIEKDEWGREVKTHPIVAFSLFVSRDLWRYGLVRGMRSPQDEVNFRLSKMLHWLMVNQLFYEPGSLEDDVETVRREINRPDGLVRVRNVQGFKVERGLDVVAALGKAGEDARQFLEMGGPNPQLQGEQGRATSGRAVLALQQAGLGQLGPIFDRLHEWELRVYRAIWARIQQFWTAPMYVRVTDDKNAARFAAVNGAPVVQEDNGNAPAQQPQDPRMMIGANGGPPGDPLAPNEPQEQETGPMLAELDMDIIIDRAPEAATLQAEQFEEMAKLAQAGVLPPGPDTARMIITSSALPNKSELLDMLDKIAKQPQKPDPKMMAELKELAAKVELMISQRDLNRAKTAETGASIPKTQAETVLTQAEARTANVDATMNEIGAVRALDFGAPQPVTRGSLAPDPLAAAAPPGAIGLPPTQG